MYGTIPIVHATGGLKDSVRSWYSEKETSTGAVTHGDPVGAAVGHPEKNLGNFEENSKKPEKIGTRWR